MIAKCKLQLYWTFFKWQGEASKQIANKIPTGLVSAVSNMNDWSMKPSERLNYDKMFESLRPVNGTVAGDKVNILHFNSNTVICFIINYFLG